MITSEGLTVLYRTCCMTLACQWYLITFSPGLQLAALSTIPASIVKHAEEISTQIQQQRKVQRPQIVNTDKDTLILKSKAACDVDRSIH